MNSRRLLVLSLAAGALLSPLVHAAETAAAPANAADVWDLTLLYPDDAAWRAAKDRVAAGIPKLKAYQGRLGENAATLREALDLVYSLRKDFIRLSSYASLNLDENTRNAPALERTQEIGLLGTEFGRATSFVNPELLAVGEAKILGYVASEPGLANYRFPLLEILRAAPHTLSADAESVMSAASLVTGAPSSLYGILANADLPWPTIKLADGTEARLDQSGYTKWRSAANRADREAVFQAFWKRVRDYERTFGVALFSQVKVDWFRASTRKYTSSLAAALDDDNIPEAVYRTLLTETNANLPTLHRYFKLRGRMLGVADLRYWDIYPPIVQLDKKFPLADGKTLAIAAIAPLGRDYVADFTASLNGRYTHVYPQPGKRSGAYMSGSVHDAHAYVLTNYNDDYESVSTLAHEWGHGIHSTLANRTQPLPVARYSIFTAEIASTLNEALLLDHMLKIAANDSERLYYLGSALEGLRGTFFRQAMFAEFELAIHEVVEKGGALSGQKFSQVYGDILRRHHGHDQGVLKIDDLVTVEWAYIPHFYRNFYVFQYATSIAAGQAFAKRILDGTPGAVDTYLGLLKAGGSDHPYELVKRAGVDLATPEPYRALVARMNAIMDQIEAILARQVPINPFPLRSMPLHPLKSSFLSVGDVGVSSTIAMAVLGVALAGGVAFGLFKWISPRGRVVSPAQLGRKWFAWFTVIATVTLLPKFIRQRDGDSFAMWLIAIVAYGGAVFVFGWLYGLFKFKSRGSSGSVVATAEQATVPTSGSPVVTSDKGCRLAELKELFEQGLISKQEYESKRENIIAQL